VYEGKVFSEHEIKKENTLDDEQTKTGITSQVRCRLVFRKLFGSNLGWDTPQSLQENFRTAP
jgi:hypothetical protein